MGARISYIVHVLNEERVLERALRRLRAILEGGDELIVVDEGSRDGSLSIAGRYADKIVRMPKVETFGRARNLGAKAASGDIIASIDPDVVVPLDTRRRLLEAFSDQGVVAVLADVRVYPEEESALDAFWHVFMNLRMRLSLKIMPNGKGEFQAFRREAFERVGGYREDLESVEDCDMITRVSRVGRVVFLPKGFAVRESPRRYRLHGYLRSYLYWTLNWIRYLFGLPLPRYERISH